MDRRKFIIGASAGIAGLYFAASKLFDVKAVIDPSLNLSVDRNSPSFEVFYELSKIVTSQPNISKPLAAKYFKVFQAEPWGKQHISGCYLGIKKALTAPANKLKSLEQIINSDYLSGGEKWFISHLLITWYLGIYYHETTAPTQVSYENALMWDAVKDVTSITGVSHPNKPNFWSEKP